MVHYQCVRLPMTVRSVGMVHTAQNMNGARDPSQISRWKRPNLTIFLSVESVCDDQQFISTELYGTTTPHTHKTSRYDRIERPRGWADS